MSTFKYSDPLGKTYVTRERRHNIHESSDIVTNPVELVDLFPTLVDLACLPPIPVCPTSKEKVEMHLP